MPKRKADGAEDKDSKVTKQEVRRSERLKPAGGGAKADVKPKKPEKAVVKKQVEEKPAVKAKKVVAKGKNDAGVSQNGQAKDEETEEAESVTEEKA